MQAIQTIQTIATIYESVSRNSGLPNLNQRFLDTSKREHSSAKKCEGDTCDYELQCDVPYKCELLNVLGKSRTFTDQEEASIANAIVRFGSDHVTSFKAVNLSLPEVVDGIAAQLARDEELTNKCTICFEHLPYSPTALPCHPTHVFHNDCIKQWVHTQGPDLCTCITKIPCVKNVYLTVFYRLNKPRCPLCWEKFIPDRLHIMNRKDIENTPGL